MAKKYVKVSDRINSVISKAKDSIEGRYIVGNEEIEARNYLDQIGGILSNSGDKWETRLEKVYGVMQDAKTNVDIYNGLRDSFGQILGEVGNLDYLKKSYLNNGSHDNAVVMKYVINCLDNYPESSKEILETSINKNEGSLERIVSPNAEKGKLIGRITEKGFQRFDESIGEESYIKGGDRINTISESDSTSDFSGIEKVKSKKGFFKRAVAGLMVPIMAMGFAYGSLCHKRDVNASDLTENFNSNIGEIIVDKNLSDVDYAQTARDEGYWEITSEKGTRNINENNRIALERLVKAFPNAKKGDIHLQRDSTGKDWKYALVGEDPRDINSWYALGLDKPVSNKESVEKRKPEIMVKSSPTNVEEENPPEKIYPGKVLNSEVPDINENEQNISGSVRDLEGLTDEGLSDIYSPRKTIIGENLEEDPITNDESIKEKKRKAFRKTSPVEDGYNPLNDDDYLANIPQIKLGELLYINYAKGTSSYFNEDGKFTGSSLEGIKKTFGDNLDGTIGGLKSFGDMGYSSEKTGDRINLIGDRYKEILTPKTVKDSEYKDNKIITSVTSPVRLAKAVLGTGTGLLGIVTGGATDSVLKTVGGFAGDAIETVGETGATILTEVNTGIKKTEEAVGFENAPISNTIGTGIVVGEKLFVNGIKLRPWNESSITIVDGKHYDLGLWGPAGEMAIGFFGWSKINNESVRDGEEIFKKKKSKENNISGGRGDSLPGGGLSSDSVGARGGSLPGGL